jgi:hypothetical protein
MRRLVGILGVLALPTVVYVVAVLLAPGRASLITHIYLVVVAGGGLAVLAVALARSLRPTGPPAFEQGLRRRPQPVARVNQLERLEREVTLGLENAWDLHNRLCPTVRETAAGLLRDRRGIDLERQPERTAALVGPDAWELIRPDRPAPERRHDPGVSAGSLDRALTALEQL